MHYIRHIFNSRFFFNLYSPVQNLFRTVSVIAFGYSMFFITKHFLLFDNTTNKIQNDTKPNIPYEEKYNTVFDNTKPNIPYEEKYNTVFDNTKTNDECNISSEKLKQTFVSLKKSYNLELKAMQSEYEELKYLYDNSNSEEDDDSSIDNDDNVKKLKENINNLQTLLKNEDQIKNNAINKCLSDTKSNLMVYLQNNYILENTPVGNVIMVYNNNKKGFLYYSDKTISNKYLESVCKKYCIQFKCKILFNNVFINEGKLSNFKFLKNEIKNKNKKNSNLSFRSFKEQFSLL